MTTALDTQALDRLDDGLALPGDVLLAEVFDLHCRWGQPVPCLICGAENGPECTGCVIDHDDLMRRAADV